MMSARAIFLVFWMMLLGESLARAQAYFERAAEEKPETNGNNLPIRSARWVN